MNHDALIVAVAAAVTIAIRFLPFIFFRDGQEVPDKIAYLGKTLPSAVMGMLVVYCLKDVTVTQPPYAVPELIAVVITVGSYLWKKNTSVSVILGTLCYMFLVQRIF